MTFKMHSMTVSTTEIFHLFPSKPTRDDMKNAILASNGSAGSNSSLSSKTVNAQTSKPRVNDVTYVYRSDWFAFSIKFSPRVQPLFDHRKAHGLHMADLITGLRHSLWTEVPLLAEIDDKAHSALMKYLEILIKVSIYLDSYYIALFIITIIY